MAQQTDAATQTPNISCVFSPDKSDPAAAEKFVRSIFKHEPNNADLVAAELAPLFGLGPNSSQDPVARWRAQTVFNSPQILVPLKEFIKYFVRDQFGLPLAKWAGTLNLVHELRNDKHWTHYLCPLPDGGTPEQYYARFIILMLESLATPTGRKGANLLLWLGDGIRAGQEDDVSWILFHAIMCFQIKRMNLNKYHASKETIATYYFHKFFDQVSKFVSAHKGAGELDPALH
ncbi:hypothetical protein F4860DRAFT_510125 [Xylaria cubensis]|nr:hypothetical protein F4860DRAFT_510125 [Xylaria cubensis]